jgi:hypothetical protein
VSTSPANLFALQYRPYGCRMKAPGAGMIPDAFAGLAMKFASESVSPRPCHQKSRRCGAFAAKSYSFGTTSQYGWTLPSIFER